MKLKMYSVYDSKVEAYMKPFYMRARGEAIRSFAQEVNRSDSDLGKYPADFTLFEIGTFDESTCKLDVFEAKISIGTALDFKDKPTGTLPLFAQKEQKEDK